MPEGKTPSLFQIELEGIISNVTENFKIESLEAFPVRGYHTVKKTYFRVYNTTTKQRKLALNAVWVNGLETASDDNELVLSMLCIEIAIEI